MNNFEFPDNLDDLKYSQLQKIAKQIGIKANMKAHLLLKLLKQHHNICETKGNREANLFSLADVEKEVVDEIVKSDDPCIIEEDAEISFKNKEVVTQPPDYKISSVEGESLVSSETKQKKRRASRDDDIIPMKRTRLSTYSLTTQVADVSVTMTTSSPGVLKASDETIVELMDCMKENMSDGELKTSLNSTLDKRAKRNCAPDGKSTLIPRYKAIAANKTENSGAVGASTNKFALLHQRAFDKMLPLDEYRQKRQKRAELLTSSARKPGEGAGKRARKEGEESIAATEKAFLPSQSSVRKMDFNFGKTTVETSQGTARKLFRFSGLRSTPGIKEMSKSMLRNDVLTPSARSTQHNQSHVGNSTAKKSTFDLQASLAKPVTWKLKTGKVPTLEGQSINQRVNLKEVRVASREQRVKDCQSNQAKKRLDMVMKNRQ